jgi:hypothetical protein
LAVIPERLSGYPDVARFYFVNPVEAFEQSRLAGAIRPDDGDPFTFPNSHRDIAEDHPATE